ncbi:piggyBac transposable element-derived protein 3-like protein [Lates japonicus]|uniref:PiggyBac transposable element-derived protein 3-like protein n=1 Tax=Lates japonicus TaxID=270547 RepID=A0AAD3MV76_LATJO|nr:piggyBac transposable element-derived protein 3-like protein [Lates japonicus]
MDARASNDAKGVLFGTTADLDTLLAEDGLPDDNESVDEEENEDDEVSQEDVPRLPRWKTPHSANITDYPEWQANLPKSDNIKSPYEYFKMFFLLLLK